MGRKFRWKVGDKGGWMERDEKKEREGRKILREEQKRYRERKIMRLMGEGTPNASVPTPVRRISRMRGGMEDDGRESREQEI